MFIAITSPKKGLGQTVTSINLAAMISEIAQKKCLLIDFNQNFRDVARYLSASIANKGIDDFINLQAIELKDEGDLLKKCTKQVHNKIDIMTANICLKIDRSDIESLTEFSKREYSFVIADTIAGNSEITKAILEKADLAVTILSQDTNVVELAIAKSKAYELPQKNIYVVNKYIKEINNQKVGMCYKKIKKTLEQKGIENKNVFKLDFDVRLLNECNDSTLLNYAFCRNREATVNGLQYRKIAEHILCQHVNYSLVKESKRQYNANWNIMKLFAKRG
ncbi:MAG: hypothetical protein ACLKAK_03245 [Alkaliphilus sp.]